MPHDKPSKMLSAGTEGLGKVPTPTFHFGRTNPGLKTPTQFQFNTPPPSPNRSVRLGSSPRPVLGAATRDIESPNLSSDNSSLLPTTHTKLTQAFGDDPTNCKPKNVALIMEKNVFHNDRTIKLVQIIKTCKELGFGKYIELPRVCVLS